MAITCKHEFDIRTDCWGGAEDRIQELTSDQLDDLENVLEDYFADNDDITDATINDFIWFEEDTWRDWIGLSDEEEDEDYYDEDEEEDEDFEWDYEEEEE